MTKLKLAVVTDGRSVPRFMLDAIDEISGCDAISVFACTNTRSKRRPVKHAAYYALNLLSVRNRLSRPVALAAGRKPVERYVEFASDYEGAWQRLPQGVLDELRSGGFDIILKVGMGLLRVPAADVLPAPILSFHHGDPDCYCGRPAGFWEMLHGRPVMGQIVQRLSNKVDAGQVLAFGETKVHPHSYRATLIEAYRHSPLLINQAIRNARAGTPIVKASNGKNYRLPSNLTVLRFVAGMTARFVGRVAYGAFAEKGWRVSLASVDAAPAALVGGGAPFPPAGEWRTLEPAGNHIFYADPFFSARPPGVLVEAMNRRSGLGEIVLVGEGGPSRVSQSGEHFSYPCTALIEGEQIVVPETAVSSAAMAYRLTDGVMEPLCPLRIDARDGLIDPTVHVEDGRVYLFANLLSIGPNALFLWSAPALDAPFERHPLSPILVSPLGARMGGSLLRDEGRLLRLGQDFSGEYGHGLVAFEIEEIGPATYSERPIGSVRFSDRRGPHTLNVRAGELAFDWYRQRIAPLAGFRRLLAYRRARLGVRERSGSPDADVQALRPQATQ
jgi:hypothetical protein